MLLTVVYMLIYLFCMLFFGKKIFHRIARNWAKVLLIVSGIKVEIIDNAKLDKSESYIYTVNHSSLYDIPILLSALNDNARIMYKKELEKIPFFGWGLAASPFISVKRSDPRNAMASIDESANAIKNGDSVIIFPEGTRSETGELGEFKRGAFLLAKKSGKRTVPITLIGSWKILPKGKKIIKSGKVILIIDKPLSEELTDKNSIIETKRILTENLLNSNNIW